MQLERPLGRLEINVALRLVDALLMLLLAYLPTGRGRAREYLVLVHLARMGVANCSRPLTRAMLMDNVPSALRARWNAADRWVRTGGWVA